LNVTQPKWLRSLACNANDPRYVDMWQFVVAGVEIVKAYSELVDPLDQRERFEEQMRARAAGDEDRGKSVRVRCGRRGGRGRWRACVAPVHRAAQDGNPPVRVD